MQVKYLLDELFTTQFLETKVFTHRQLYREARGHRLLFKKNVGEGCSIDGHFSIFQVVFKLKKILQLLGSLKSYSTFTWRNNW